jgi:hypothetical protein
MAREVNLELRKAWRERIERQRRSGLAVAEFSRQEGVSAASFYLWKRKFQGEASPPSWENESASFLYSRTPKSGCRIENRQFKFLARKLNAIAVYMLVAWRVMLLCRLGRECPDLDCEVLFEPSEWKAVYTIVKRVAPSTTPPRLNEIIRMIASLGGYVPRTTTESGTQTLWIGRQRMHDFANCYDSFGPPTRKH